MEQITSANLIRKMSLLFENKLYRIKTKSLRTMRKTPINSPSASPAGLELAGKKINDECFPYLVIWGSRESKFLDLNSDAESTRVIDKLLDMKPPLIFISKGFSVKWLKIVEKLALPKKVGVVTSILHARDISADIYHILAPFFATKTTIHGSGVVVENIGIFLIGKSGIGKSETLIDLISRGHFFIGDDSIVVKQVGSSFIMESSEITKNLIESRGIGIIDASRVFGRKSMLESHSLQLVIKLEKMDEIADINRLDFRLDQYKIGGIPLPLVTLPISPGRNVATMVELAARVFSARLQKGFVSPLKLIARRFKNATK